MKTAVAFVSRKGYVSELVDKIKSELDDKVDVFNLGKRANIELDKYDCLVLAGSVIAGRLSGKIKKFLIKNIQKIKGKKIYFLYAGFDDKDYLETIKRNFGAETFGKISEVVYGGGRYLPEQHSGIVRKLMTKINGAEGAVHKEQPENIEKLITKLA